MWWHALQKVMLPQNGDFSMLKRYSSTLNSIPPHYSGGHFSPVPVGRSCPERARRSSPTPLTNRCIPISYENSLFWNIITFYGRNCPWARLSLFSFAYLPYILPSRMCGKSKFFIIISKYRSLGRNHDPYKTPTKGLTATTAT